MSETEKKKKEKTLNKNIYIAHHWV